MAAFLLGSRNNFEIEKDFFSRRETLTEQMNRFKEYERSNVDEAERLFDLGNALIEYAQQDNLNAIQDLITLLKPRVSMQSRFSCSHFNYPYSGAILILAYC